MTNAGKPILVTGSHRSGTTWIGRNLALAPHTGYIHEPFNVDIRISVIESPMNYWYLYICEENASKYQDNLNKVIVYKYPLLDNLNRSRSVKDVAKTCRDQGNSLLHKMGRSRPIVKDPIAFFSAEWLSQTYGMEVLVTIRHPAAFCSSLKIKNWKFSFKNFLDQPLLMERYLGRFEEDIREFAQEEKSIIDQAILLWNCIQHTVNIYQQCHPEWVFVRHEDLSREPLESFRSLYRRFDLEFTPRVKSGILESSGSHNPQEQQPDNEFKRDSRANIKNWKNRLSREEIDHIRLKTGEVSQLFYEDDEW